MQEVFEKIIEKVENIKQRTSDLLEYDVADEVDSICNEIFDLIDSYNNGWIPVEERLPEKKMEVLICNEMGEMTSTWYIPWAENSKAFKRFAHRIGGYETVAWQPLPPKYQPKGDK